ncbi:MAG TPA: hypothetical protein ENN03_03925 [bacterium]|nr:hypothetical protein [bacterium]
MAIPLNKKKRMKWMRIGVLSLFLIGIGLTRCGSTRPVNSLSQAFREKNLESFDFVWSAIHAQHFDTTFGGADWPAVREELRPEMDRAESMREARAVLLEMIGRLNLSHFSIIPSELYQNLEMTDPAEDRSGDTGIDVFVNRESVWVQSIRPESPAEKADLRTGWEIVAVDDQSLKPLLLNLDREFGRKSTKTLFMTREITNRLTGPPGGSVRLKLVNLEEDTLTVRLSLEQKPGLEYQIGHLPPQFIQYESRWLDESIGYIRFNNFLDPVRLMTAFNRDMLNFLKADGIIIDIRGNGGGIVAMAMGMAGWFVSEKQQYLGTLHFRENEIKAVIFPRANSYHGPLAILVDELSASTSEIFAGGLQDIERAVIVGSRTAGATLPSTIVRLPNGDAFQYVLANYVSRGGTVLEGRGVAPDLAVTHTPESLASGTDRPLVKAVEIIRSSGKQ